LSRWTHYALLAVASAFALVSCHSSTDPTPICYSAPPEGTYQAALYRVTGAGQCDNGGTSISPFDDGGTFGAIIRFRVNRARPNTTYIVQRAAEVGAPLSSDGICQKADGLPPWTPAEGFTGSHFVTFPLGGRIVPDPGPKLTLTTDADGSGSRDFEFHGSVSSGTKFDVEMRLVDSETAPASDLRSGCMTVTVK
jgi:hypothetical protein